MRGRLQQYVERCVLVARSLASSGEGHWLSCASDVVVCGIVSASSGVSPC